MPIKHDDEIEVYKEEIPPDIDKIKKVLFKKVAHTSWSLIRHGELINNQELE